MNWMNANCYFDDRSIVLTLGRKFPNERRLVEAMQEFERDPEALESMARSIVLQARPNLAGCSIWWLGFNAMRNLFEIGVSHADLPRVPFGSERKRAPLFEENRPEVMPPPSLEMGVQVLDCLTGETK